MEASLVDFEPRLYQETIFATAALKNTLIVLPTGLGKTNIFLMLASHRLSTYPKSKIVLLGPTRPLIDQYAEVFRRHLSLPPESYATLTGFVPPQKRRELWQRAQIIFSTPQGLENDVVSGTISFENVSLLGIDEAHRAVKSYSYVWICKQYLSAAAHPRVIGMTASPGDTLETIEEVVANLGVEAIEIRTEEDSDVAPYIQDVSVTYHRIPIPLEIAALRKALTQLYQSRIASLRRTGYFNAGANDASKSSLLSLQSTLRQSLSDGSSPEIFAAISLAAEALKIQHALELAETQTLRSLFEYLEQLFILGGRGANKAVVRIVRDPLFTYARKGVADLIASGFQHPKITSLINVLADLSQKNRDFRAIVFTQYRDTGSEVREVLEQKGISARLFVGQAKKKNTGLSQKEQKGMTDEFRAGKFHVLVSSSVGEEGLDIPAVDMVVFFEPIPSVIRKIQRSGRTGRLEEGAVVVLMMQGTRDETYHYVSKAKEQRMHRAIIALKRKLLSLPMQHAFPLQTPPPTTSPSLFAERGQGTTQSPPSSGPGLDSLQDALAPQIVVDSREKSNPLVKELFSLGCHITLEPLHVGDYLLAKDVMVEFKTVADFVDSIVDGRLLEQAKELCKAPRPLLVIEGQEDIYAQRGVHPNAIRGMIATLTLGFRIPLIQTRGPKETAALFALIAKREQDPNSSIAGNHKGKPATLAQLQEYVTGSLPGIGSILSVPLLAHFKTIQNIANASEKDLQNVELIGDKKAKSIHDLFRAEYQKR